MEESSGRKNASAGILADRDRRVAEARKFNLLSNVFMSVALNDKTACQYVLRILTGIRDLTVREIRTQYRMAKVQSHDAVLDILAEDACGRLYNLEIQQADTIDHARRTRFYGAMIDSEYLEKGKTYAELPDVYVIYVSETDLWRAGYVTYPVEKYFKTADPDDMTHGDLSRRIHYLKREEGGFQEMCEVSEKIYREGMEYGRAEGKLESRKETAQNLSEMGMSAVDIAKALKVSVELVREWLADSRNSV